jgi:leader peptidase (prepilin peptidase)/N-methyltransferase
MTLASLPLSFYRTVAVIFGLLWGSFLNVVIHRMPREESVVSPGSNCACGTPIPAYRNIPVISWLLMGGKAPCCGVKVSPRYVIVEILGGLLSLAVFEVLVRDLGAGTSLGRAALVYVSHFAVCCILLAATFIDFEWMIIPDELNYGAAVLGAATFWFRGMSIVDVVVGGILPPLGLWLFTKGYAKLRGIDGMGMGDFKLLVAVGAWFGWKGTVFVIFAGAVQGTLAAIAMKLTGGSIPLPPNVQAELDEVRKLAEEGTPEEQEEAKKILEEELLTQVDGSFGRSALPMGPFLVLGFYEWLFAHDVILERFQSFTMPG